MARNITVTNYESGIPTDASAVTLADPTAAYGIRETITGNVVVASGAATVNEDTGLYTYDITLLDTTLEYEYYFRIARTSGDVEFISGTIPIATFLPTGTSYSTVLEADIYFSNRLNTSVWDDSTETEKTKALIMGTQIIDRLNYKGDKTVDTQTAQFPRGGDTDVPDDIKYANDEIALALLDGVDPELEYENLFMTSQGYSNVRSTYNREIMPGHVVAGAPSVTAWRYLQPYVRDNAYFDISRVS